MAVTAKQKGTIIAIIFILIMVLPVSWVMLSHYRQRHAAKMRTKPVRPEFNYKVTVHDSLPQGYLLLSPYNMGELRYGRLVIIDFDGNVVFDRKADSAIYDFRQWKVDGHTRYSYFINNPKAMHIKQIGLAAGHIVILDSAMNEIKQVHLLPYGDVVLNNRQDLDPHDFILLSDDHYFTMGCYERHVDNIPAALHPSPAIKVAVPIIQEIKNGSVVWQWDASKYPEFYANSAEHNNYADTTKTQDYMHINSMFIDPADSNLIVSFRTQDQIIKINRKNGDIVWRLGGKTSDFHLEPEQQFLRQHNAKLIEDNQVLLVYDNGDSATRRKSRVLEFQLDQKNKKINGFRSFDIPEAFTQYMGSADKYGEDYLIGGGSGKYVLEINSRTGKKKFELLNNLSFYRAYKVTDIKGIK